MWRCLCALNHAKYVEVLCRCLTSEQRQDPLRVGLPITWASEWDDIHRADRDVGLLCVKTKILIRAIPLGVIQDEQKHPPHLILTYHCWYTVQPDHPAEGAEEKSESLRNSLVNIC